MKLYSVLLATLLVFSSAIAQENDIEVFEKKEGNKNVVFARNTGKMSYLVSITITAKGMDVTPGISVEAVVPPGYMKELASLTPRPGEAWSYGYDVSYMEHTGQEVKSPTAPTTQTGSPGTPSLGATPPSAAKAELSSSPIIVYTQVGCGRCSTVKKEMKAKGIVFEEVDVNSGSPEVNAMWKNLRDGGFTGNNVTMPVVKVNGQLHYNIKDLLGFVDELKK